MFLHLALFLQHPEWGPEPPVAPYTKSRLPHPKKFLNLIFPVLAQVRFHDDYDVNRGKFRHTGIDIPATKMSPIVAPFSGTLGLKRESFWIYGDNGWDMLGTHLNDDDLGTHNKSGNRDVMFAPNLFPGEHVVAGQFIGYVGMSGDATGPHLHFELYAPGKQIASKRIIDPFASLKYARHIHEPKVVLMDVDPHLTGATRLEGCIRKLNQSEGTITLLLVDKKPPMKQATEITTPRWVTLHIAPEVVEQAGGWNLLKYLPTTQQIAAFVNNEKIDGADVRKLVLGRDIKLSAQNMQ